MIESIRCTVEVPLEAMFSCDTKDEILRWLALEHPEDLVKCGMFEIPFEQRTFIDALAKEVDRLEDNTLNQLKFMVEAELLKRDTNLKEVNDVYTE